MLDTGVQKFVEVFPPELGMPGHFEQISSVTRQIGAFVARHHGSAHGRKR